MYPHFSILQHIITKPFPAQGMFFWPTESSTHVPAWNNSTFQKQRLWENPGSSSRKQKGRLPEPERTREFRCQRASAEDQGQRREKTNSEGTTTNSSRNCRTEQWEQSQWQVKESRQCRHWFLFWGHSDGCDVVGIPADQRQLVKHSDQHQPPCSPHSQSLDLLSSKFWCWISTSVSLSK